MPPLMQAEHSTILLRVKLSTLVNLLVRQCFRFVFVVLGYQITLSFKSVAFSVLWIRHKYNL